MDLFEFQRQQSKANLPAAAMAELVRPVSLLYVSTSLEIWEPTQPDLLARDVTLNGVCFRKLDPEYYAWLRHKLTLAEKALEMGKIAYEAFDALLMRFNDVHMWAVDRFGRDNLTAAMESADHKKYVLPGVVTSMPPGGTRPDATNSRT